MNDRGFLTNKNRDVLFGRYDGTENARRNQKSRIRSRASNALNDLITVADSGEIDNADTIDPEQVYRLLVALTVDRNSFGSDNPDDPHNKQVDEDFRREVLEAVDQFRLLYHEQNKFAEPTAEGSQ